jgi:hypothetical protein
MATVAWKNEPDEHDYPAAGDYLTLIAPPDVVEHLVDGLRAAEIIHQKAKDILRASELVLLDVENPHVAADLKKVKKGIELSPVLLIQGDLASDRRLQIADGYHRVCASYHVDENTDIPCRLAPFDVKPNR